MQIKELKRESLSCELEITLPAADIDRHVDVQLARVGKTMKLPGFRPGKVPMAMLKSRYGKSVLGEVLEKAVNESSAKALADKGLRPAMQPRVEVKAFDDGQDLVFTMAVELLPEFTVMDLKTIAVDRPVAKIEDKVIEETLTRVAEQHGAPADLEKPRASKDGDMLTIAFVGKTDDGVALPGMSAEDFKIRIGSGNLIPGFEDQLIGLNVGDKKDVKVTFPENYGQAELAGKPATFAVTVAAIQEYRTPAIDDALAGKLGFGDVAALRKAVEYQIASDYGRQTRLKVKRALLDVLDEGHQFDLPAGMVDLEYKGIVRQVEAEAHAKEHDHAHDDDPNHAKHSHLSEEEKEELRAIAERRVRLGLVLSEVGRANAVTVNDGELQRAVINEIGRYPGQEKMVLDYYRKNPQAMESLRAPLFEEKVVDFILELANVTDVPVSVDDLMAEDEDDVAGYKKPPAKKAAAKKPAAKKAKADEAASGDLLGDEAAEKPAKKTPAKKKAE